LKAAVDKGAIPPHLPASTASRRDGGVVTQRTAKPKRIGGIPLKFAFSASI